MRKIPLILDGDPGHDDAIAWMLAKAIPEFDILAVCSAAGNQITEKTTFNAQRICALLGIDAPIAQGSSVPLMAELVTAGNWHGESGLDGAEMPAPKALSGMPASALMAKVIRESSEPVTIVATGPLTNVAELLLTCPELKEKIAKISIMGGGITLGNWTPAAEFNILEDPEAADIVFRSGIPMIMCGLDVTEQAQILPEDIDSIRSVGNHVADVVADWVSFFIKHPMGIGYAGGPVHDPLAVLALVYPDMFEMHDYPVQIDLTGEYTRGETVCDFRRPVPGAKGPAANVCCITGIDRERYIEVICERLHAYDEVKSDAPAALHLHPADGRTLFAAPKYQYVQEADPAEDEKIPVWIDTDAGTDDAMALMTAFSLPQLDIKGISAVSGNVELKHTFRNARDIVQLMGAADRVKVYPGASRPMLRELETAKHVHGEKGLGSASLPPSAAPQETEKAWDALYRCAVENSGRLDLILLGPQTNAAIALNKYPDLAGHLHRILFMGGADVGGNVTMAAEFNIYVDPHAAETVCLSGVPLVMCGLDVTTKAYLTTDDYRKMETLNTDRSRFALDVMRDGRSRRGDENCCQHDTCPIIYAAKPSLFKAMKGGVHVETRSALTLGQTVTDIHTDVKFKDPNASVVLDLDREAFADIMLNALR